MTYVKLEPGWLAKQLERTRMRTNTSNVEDELFEIDLFYHFETQEAIKVSEFGVEENAFWLPFSQIQIDEKKRSKSGDMIYHVSMPEWLAQKKDLI